MSGLEEIIGALGAVVDKIEEAAAGAASAGAEAEQGLGQASALGLSSAAEGFGRLGEEIDQLAGILAAATQGANDALATANALADGT